MTTLTTWAASRNRRSASGSGSALRAALLLAAAAAWLASAPADGGEGCPASFAPAVDHAAVSGPISVAIGDLNEDGRPDLAVANGDSNSVSVLLGNGDGTFAAAVDYDTGPRPEVVAIGDLNDDGRPDLAVAGGDGNSVWLLPGNGDGTFAAAVRYGTGVRAGSMAIGDLNEDGRPDLVVAGGESTSVSVLLSNDDGKLAAAVDYDTGTRPEAVAIGDLDADGRPDLAVAGGSGVSVLSGNGDGTFGAAVPYGTAVQAASMAIADLNDDGWPDLALANLAGTSVSVLLANGDGTFAAAVNHAAGSPPDSVAVGDLDGDGKPDLAVTHSVDNSLSVLLNRTTACGAAPTISPCCQSLQFTCWDYGATCVDTGPGAQDCGCCVSCNANDACDCFVPEGQCVEDAGACGAAACLPTCGFGTCAVGEFCCNGNQCCKEGTQTCPTTECVTICAGGTPTCGEGCCAPGEACFSGVCRTLCGFTSCDVETEVCCGDVCCPASTHTCGTTPSTCVLQEECGEGTTYIPALNYCCPDAAYCPNDGDGTCCNLIAGERCLSSPQGYQCEQYGGGPTPGEVSKTVAMLVTGYDKVTGSITVSYDPACGATDNAVYYGLLASLPVTYAYAGQICGVGNTGTATFDVPEGSFFVVVGRDDTFEGSYGTMLVAGTPSERPEVTMCPACPLPRNLYDRCD